MRECIICGRWAPIGVLCVAHSQLAHLRNRVIDGDLTDWTVSAWDHARLMTTSPGAHRLLTYKRQVFQLMARLGPRLDWPPYPDIPDFNDGPSGDEGDA